MYPFAIWHLRPVIRHDIRAQQQLLPSALKAHHMEQQVSRFLITQLGYNASADSTLSSNCRGNLKGLWEFIIDKYKTADTKRHIQHVLAKHKQEQEAALRAPEEQREADARRQRLLQLRKENAELEQCVASLQSRTESRVQEATEQACEHSLLQHALQDTQQKALLVQAFVHRGQQLLPALQARLSHLSHTLDMIKARTKATGGSKALQAVQQQLAALSSSIKGGLHTAMADHVGHAGLSGTGTDLQLPSDQAQGATAPGEQQQQALVLSTLEALQQQLRVCNLLQGYKLPPDVAGAAMQLLQYPPSFLWELSAQLAQQNLLELTACIDEAQQEMLAPLLWPGGSAASAQHLLDQQQLMAKYGDVVGSRYKLPWASGMSLLSAAAMQEMGLSPPPEIRVKQRLRDHVQLHVQTEQTIQRVLAAQRELSTVLSSTPLLNAAAAAAAEQGAAAVSWQGQFAQLFVSIAGLQAQAKTLQQFEQQLEQELLRLQEAREITQDKDLQVRQQMADDEELNMLLHMAAADTMELEAALSQHQARAAQLVSVQLLPCNAAAAEAAAAAVGLQQREAAAVGKLPLQDLLVGPKAATEAAQQQLRRGAGVPSNTSDSSSSNPVLQWTTLSRLQAAARQLLLTSSATTGAKGLGHNAAAAAAAGSSRDGGSRRLGDTAAAAALKGASVLDPIAAVRCPAALLVDIAGQSQEDRQLQQQAEALSSTSNLVAASCNTAVHHEQQLRDQVAQLHEREHQEVLPRLQSLLEEVQTARVFAREQLVTDLKQSWQMPAMHLVPHHTYRGRNCTQWLAELQHWHAKKVELSTD